MAGVLYVCGTPIGNLEDVTIRLLRVLKEADIIAAEDTRRTRKLMTAHSISGKLISCHDANEKAQSAFITRRLQDGLDVALVTDGGMPGISDPGYRVVQAAIEAEIRVEVVPGPSAILAALVVSGLPTARFSFEGFLSRKSSEKKRRLQKLSTDDRTLVFFESPKRTAGTLGAIVEVMGDRQAAVARELTKIHEQVIRGTISHIMQELPDPLLGEVVIVVAGADEPAQTIDEAVACASALVEQGLAKSKAAAEAAQRSGLPRREVYERLLDTD